MKWYNVELNRNDADKLKYLLKQEGIKYEASGGCESLIHFEILLNAGGKQFDKVNRFLETL